MRVMSLLKTFTAGQVVEMVELARIRGTSDPDAIALMLDQASSPQYSDTPLIINASIAGTTRPTVDMTRYATEELAERAA